MDGLAWMDEAEALDLLRVSADNTSIVEALAMSVPPYIEALTGYPADLVEDGDCDEIVRQLARFVLLLWYNPDGSDGERLEQVVGSLAKSVRALVVAGDLEAAE